jgi:antitoxin VapB
LEAAERRKAEKAARRAAEAERVRSKIAAREAERERRKSDPKWIAAAAARQQQEALRIARVVVERRTRRRLMPNQPVEAEVREPRTHPRKVEGPMPIVPIVQDNGRQIIHLPGDLAFPGVTEFTIERDGDALILRPVRPSWTSLLDEPPGDPNFLLDRPDVMSPRGGHEAE